MYYRTAFLHVHILSICFQDFTHVNKCRRHFNNHSAFLHTRTYPHIYIFCKDDIEQDLFCNSCLLREGDGWGGGGVGGEGPKGGTIQCKKENERMFIYLLHVVNFYKQ
jgi:hypothetical protein